MLRDIKWPRTYKTDDGSLAGRFYTPVLTESVRYDRGTGYFSAGSLSLSMRGIEGLIHNGGKMRLLVGCTLNAKEVEAIRRGEKLREQVERNLRGVQLDLPDPDTADALELLSWMIAQGHMEIKIAVMCNEKGEPLGGSQIYHQKIGIAEDSAGDKIAWVGSDNMTPQGLSMNSEAMSVFPSWEQPDYVQDIESGFENDWSGRNVRLAVMNVPEAVRRRLLEYAPPTGRLPVRLGHRGAGPVHGSDVWAFINSAPKLKNGEMVGAATAPVEPWPHQVQVFRRLYSCSPARLLIADEVGLGKTIQAGLFLRQAWLEGRHRILVMTPAGLTSQWQNELREKLNLDWPIYDGRRLIWQDTHAKGKNRVSQHDKEDSEPIPALSVNGMRVDGGVLYNSWTRQGPVIVSSHLARRDACAVKILNEEWDIVVLDEAHYARQTNPNNPNNRAPNKMLQLMRNLQGRTEDLILLTATPMQIHPVELYDLLDLLGMPQKWNWKNFEEFYRRLPDLSTGDFQFMSELFLASVEKYGPVDTTRLGVSELRGRNALKILEGGTVTRALSSDIDIMRKTLLSCSPIIRLVSRNTRKQMREHIRANNLDWKLGERKVDDDFVCMSVDERKAYDAVDRYIANIWNTYMGTNRQAVGFALTIYRKRLASSFAALKVTLENHLEQLNDDASPQLYVETRPLLDEDTYNDMDPGEVEEKEKGALKELDRKAVWRLLETVKGLPPDTKLGSLISRIEDLWRSGYRQVMVFTQFTDTMDFLRDRLKQTWKVMCYSGRDGEEPGPDGRWTSLSRDEAKARFMDGKVDVLLCTDAAAEGLNFQSCGAMINYDMPWNPMRVEQRIGRIDRIGQEHNTIRIVNMYYDGTIEAQIYRKLRERIHLFEGMVGLLQPILSTFDDEIMGHVLHGNEILYEMERYVDEAHKKLDPELDAMLAAETAQYEPPESPVTMKDLARIAGNSDLMRQYRAEPAGRRQYHITSLDNKRVLITTDRGLFERHSGSMEFWSPGSPAFPELEQSSDLLKHETLGQLLDDMERRSR